MSTLSPNQIAVYATAAGIPAGADLIDAVSVAMAESSGVTDAVNPTSGNTGLWQIGPKGTINDAGVGLTSAQLKDPGTNARAMFTLWSHDGRTFKKSWSSYGNSVQLAAAAQLKAGNWGAAASTGGSLSSALTAPLSAAADATGLSGVNAIAVDFDKTARWVTTPSNWIRVALVIGGAVLAIAGLNAIAKPVTAPVVASAKKTAKTAAVVAAL